MISPAKSFATAFTAVLTICGTDCETVAFTT
jgi:hypothetical protein